VLLAVAQIMSGVILPHGQEGWRIAWKRLVLLWPHSFGLRGCVTKKKNFYSSSEV